MVLCCVRAACYCLFFFFSSRRRHTRCLSDWSSDVCSSDLAFVGEARPRVRREEGFIERHLADGCLVSVLRRHCQLENLLRDRLPVDAAARSEERRVGKECRCRRSAYQSTETRAVSKRGTAR